MQIVFSHWYWTKSSASTYINDTKLCVLVVILSTQNNVKLLKQLKSDFKRTTNWDKCQPEKTMHAQNQYLDHFIILKSWMANRSKAI